MADDESSGSDREPCRPHGWKVIEGNYGIRQRKNRLPERRVRGRASKRRAKLPPSTLARLPKERRKRSRRRRELRKRKADPMRRSLRELKDSMLRAKPQEMARALEDVLAQLRSMFPETLGTDPNG